MPSKAQRCLLHHSLSCLAPSGAALGVSRAKFLSRRSPRWTGKIRERNSPHLKAFSFSLLSCQRMRDSSFRARALNIFVSGSGFAGNWDEDPDGAWSTPALWEHLSVPTSGHPCKAGPSSSPWGWDLPEGSLCPLPTDVSPRGLMAPDSVQRSSEQELLALCPALQHEQHH